MGCDRWILLGSAENPRKFGETLQKGLTATLLDYYDIVVILD